MGHATKPIRHNRTITVDFRDETTYCALLGNTKAFVEFVFAFFLTLGFQLLHKASCSEGGCLTRHSHYARVRLGGLTIWRIQCTTCKAVFTVLPHFVLRYRTMRPEVARDALFGHPRWSQSKALRGDRPYLTDGGLSSGLFLWTPSSGARAEPVWVAVAALSLGRRKAQ